MIEFSSTDVLAIVALLGGLACVIFLAAQLDDWRDGLAPDFASRLREKIMHTLRQRAALVICAGLVILLLDWTFFVEATCDPYMQSLRHPRLPVLFGGLVTLVGVYHWIAGPPDKI